MKKEKGLCQSITKYPKIPQKGLCINCRKAKEKHFYFRKKFYCYKNREAFGRSQYKEFSECSKELEVKK